MYNWTNTCALALGGVFVLYIAQRSLSRSRAYPFPPGPPGLPWVGNVIGVNPDAPWLTYAAWAKTYGDLIYSQLLGKDIIIINSEKVARDLLENRSRNYSDRPFIITNEISGLGFNSVFLPYGERWRLHRRFLHHAFRPEAVPMFLPYQHRRACRFLRQLLDTPEQLEGHVFEYTAAVVMNSTYDYDPASRKDELVDSAANTLDILAPVLRPDIAIIIGAFPWLLRLPSWFPGMSFKKDMATAHAYSKLYLERPFEYSLGKVPNVSPSMVHGVLRLMEEAGVSPDESYLEALKGASGTAFLAASDTSNAVLMTCFLMMMMHPELQDKAQSQIDAVVGSNRLPTMSDRHSLPLIDAIFWESLRYSPVLPLSIPHSVVEDDVYEGFHIPKGAMVIANLWAMAHDESRYLDPHSFAPERFINDDGSLKPNDIEHIVFGFGRRICVGRHFAYASVWTVLAKVLAVFKILSPLDENGKEIPVEPKFSTGIAVHPLPFKCRIVPRLPRMTAEKLEQLIASSTP